jgi:chromosomal replication initiator protein
VIKQLWDECLTTLKEEFPAQQFNTWIRPLQAEARENQLFLYAPNKFILDWVNEKYLSRINELVAEIAPNNATNSKVKLVIGSTSKQKKEDEDGEGKAQTETGVAGGKKKFGRI